MLFEESKNHISYFYSQNLNFKNILQSNFVMDFCNILF